MSKNSQERYKYTQNRELSWLRFNRRVLEEAADKAVPALERLKFISIFSSNLDEFFMVRVGSLFDLSRMTPDDRDNKTGWTADEQLQNVYRTIPGLLTMKKQIYTAVMEELAHHGVQDVAMDALTVEEQKIVNRFFKAEMLPILSPILIGPNHPVPQHHSKAKKAARQSVSCRFRVVCRRFCFFPAKNVLFARKTFFCTGSPHFLTATQSKKAVFSQSRAMRISVLMMKNLKIMRRIFVFR